MELKYFGYISKKQYSDGIIYLDFSESRSQTPSIILTSKNQDIQEEIENMGDLNGFCVVVVGTPYTGFNGDRCLNIFTIRRV